MVKDDGRKFIWVSDGRHELYDLKSDPGEQANLFNIETSVPLITEIADRYEVLVGPVGRCLEIYPHADVGGRITQLPPIEVVNPSFDPASVVTL